MAVGATSDQDQVGGFSNSNVTTDVWAPGVSITSDFLGGGLFTTTGSTSSATPHATGCAALLIDAPVAELRALDGGITPGEQVTQHEVLEVLAARFIDGREMQRHTGIAPV